MKRVIALILLWAMLLTGCAQPLSTTPTTENTASVPTLPQGIQPSDITSLEDQNLLGYVEQTIYSELVSTLDAEWFYVEGVSIAYVSKEYLEEMEYNSKANIFFGYSLADLNAEFEGKRYIFTLGGDSETTVEEFVANEQENYDKLVKNVAIGTGVILVCVTVAIIAGNPSVTDTVGKTVKMLFTMSTDDEEPGTLVALKSAGIAATAAAVTEGIKTNDPQKALTAGLMAAGDELKLGAVFGTVQGIVNRIQTVDNKRYFPAGSAQAQKYPEGVEFTQAEDGTWYPRFEKWAKATATFEAPTLGNVLSQTGLSGNYAWDVNLANAQCGYLQTPTGFVWHHVEDMQTMLLIPQDLHAIAAGSTSHTGGAALIKALLGN